MTAATEREPVGLAGDRTVSHGTFSLERTYSASPDTVFAAWASRDAKHAWFADIEFLRSVEEYTLDFRVGGQEHLAGTLGRSGKRFDYDATMLDKVDGRRIVGSYEVRIDGRRISASLLTVEFVPAEGASGTRLMLTEQGAFFDDLDTNEERIVGASANLDRLERYLER